MSRSANDDRSNSMNPNNDAYYSSRGLNDDDDEDDGILINPIASFSRAAIAPPPKAHSQIYGFGAVSIEGQAVYGNVTFTALDNGMRNITSRFEDFLEFIELPVSNFLRKRLQTKILALYAVFDPTKSCLSWHVPLDLNDVDRTRDSLTVERCTSVAASLRRTAGMGSNDLSIIKCLSPDRGLSIERWHADEEAKKVDPDPYLKTLRNAIALPADAESWGELSVPYSGRPYLAEADKIFRHFTNL